MAAVSKVRSKNQGIESRAATKAFKVVQDCAPQIALIARILDFSQISSMPQIRPGYEPSINSIARGSP
jgi:hypothetical protein